MNVHVRVCLCFFVDVSWFPDLSGVFMFYGCECLCVLGYGVSPADLWHCFVLDSVPLRPHAVWYLLSGVDCQSSL